MTLSVKLVKGYLVISQAYRDVGRGHREASDELGDYTTDMRRPWSSCKRVRWTRRLPKDEAGPNNANAPEHVQGRVSLALKQGQTMETRVVAWQRLRQHSVCGHLQP